MQQELTYLKTCLEAGEACVLAVVVKTWGSAPRRPGSLMVVRGDGVFEGSVSGGCVEGNVIAEARTMVAAADHGRGFKTLEFAVATKDAWQVGLACGGTIVVMLATVITDDLPEVTNTINAIQNRESGQLTLDAIGMAFNTVTAHKAAVIEANDSILKLPVMPQPRLVIIGAVHIAQHLARLAEDCHMQVTIVDPRQAFTESRDFGTAKISSAWPDEYLQQNKVDAKTAVVTLTHDPKLDDAALRECMNGPAFYIGCLGSKKTQASRMDRLLEAGFNAGNLDRIHGPVGLDIGAANPAEIAVAIMAEIIQALRGHK